MQAVYRIGQKIASFFGEDTPLDHISEESSWDSEWITPSHFSDLIPYRLFDPERKLYENCQSIGFVLEVIPILGASEEVHQELSSLIKEIGEEGVNIQCLLWADQRINGFLQGWKHPREKKGGIFGKLAQKKTAFLKEEALLGESTPPRIFRFFFSCSLPKKQGKEPHFLLEKLQEKKKKSLATFSRLSHVTEMAPEDLLAMLSGFVNFDMGTEIKKRKSWYRDTWLSKQVCLPGGGVEVHKGGLLFHGEKETAFRSYEAVDYPDEWALFLTGELLGDFFNSAYRISAPFFLHYGIHFPSQTREETKFRGKAKILDHQCKFPALVRMFPKMPREREENHYVLQQLLEGEKFVETRLSCGFWATRDQLLKTESTLHSLYQKFGFKLQENHFLHLPDFLSTLPMAWGETAPHIQDLKRTRCMRTTLTQETGAFIPIVAEWWGNSTKGMILNGRKGQVATWDPFASEGNLNAVVIGPSGSGKSVFIQDLITSHLGQGGRVFVLDLGRSYEKLCHLVEGQFLAFSKGSEFNLNPFSLVAASEDSDTLNASLEMVSSIIATMAMPHHKIDKERADILNFLVREVWKAKQHKATIDDLIERLERATYQSELMLGAIESLKEGLKKFGQDGTYAPYFYGQNAVDLRSNLVVIETEELKNSPDLQAVILQIFTLTISNQIFLGNREQKCLICIDEAWDLLKSPQMEGFIETLARRLRKYNGSLVVGTQGVKDFERSYGARAAFQNSNWLLMLGKDGDSINILKKDNLIPMDDYMERTLSSLSKEDGKYSEVFIYHKGSGFNTVAQLKLDPFSQMLYSTQAEEFKLIQDLTRSGMSVSEAIEWIFKHQPLLKRGYSIQEIFAALEDETRQSVSEIT